MTVEQKEQHQGKLRVAIVGGGLVGSFAAIALSSLANLEVTVYEKAPGVREAGAWISLTESTLDVLTKFIDIDEINGITATPGQGHKYKIKDFKTGVTLSTQESITKTDFRYTNSKTQRLELLKLLLKYVPEGIVQYGHQINDFESNGEHVILDIDGVKKEYDLLIAADGIYSKIRQKVYPEIKLNFKGNVSYRSVFDENNAKDIENYKLEDDTLAYVGEGKIVFLSRLGLGKYGFVLGVPEEKDVIERLKWDKTLNVSDFERVKEKFKEWPPIITQLIDAAGYLNAFPLESAQWLDNLVYNDNIAFIGDAAHPTSGAYGAGAGFGFNDVWALYRALQVNGSNNWKRVKNKLNKIDEVVDANDTYNIKKALFLFNETRRHFLKDVYEQFERDNENREYIKAGKTEEEIQERIIETQSSTAWIREHNVEIEFQRVRAKNLL